MKIETQPREDHQVTLTVEVDSEQFEGARHKAARQIAGKVKISGFRPGKAPFDVVRRLYGDKVINENAMELLVDEIYPLALKEAEITPAAAGQLDNVENEPLPKFTFTIPLNPTVDLGDYKAVRLPYEWIAPGEDALEAEIQNLRRMYSKVEMLERASQDGDFVSVDVIGRKSRAKADEAALLERNAFTVLVREAVKETEWPFPGFAIHLLGLKADETKEFAHKFAKDHEDEALQGQNVKFTVKVNSVRGVNLVELNDELAQKTGLGQTVEDLRQQIRAGIAQQSRNDYYDKYFEQVLEQIKAGATVKYPPQVLEQEVGHVLKDFERQLKSQGVENFEAYYKLANTTKETFEEEQARPTAKKRLERSLIMDEIARAEKIEINQAALEEEFKNTWASLAMSDEEFNKRTKGGTKPTRETIEAVTTDSANRLMMRRTLTALKSIATGEAAAGESAEALEEKPVEGQSEKTEEEAVQEVLAEPVAEEAVAQEVPVVDEPVAEEAAAQETPVAAEPVAEEPVAQEVPVKKTRKKKPG